MKTFQERANELIQKGNSAHAQGQTETAIQAYREAIELVPAYASLHLVIGDLRFDEGRYDEAADSFEALVAFDPDHDQAWASLGQCRLMRDDLDGAGEAFDAALAARSDNVEANYYGAILAARAGDQRSAANRLFLALTQRPAWEARAREEPLLEPLFETSRKLARLGREKRWWEIWK